MLRRVTTLVLALALAALLPSPVSSTESSGLYHATTALVGYDPALDAAAERAILDLGAKVLAKEDYVPFFLVETSDPAAFVAAVAGEPGVTYSERNPLVFPEWTPVDQSYGNQWGMPSVRANLAWDTYPQRGLGAIVAVLDTGVNYQHPDLAANVWRNVDEIPANKVDDDANGYVDDIVGWDFSNNDADPLPSCGEHGTHVAGIVAATQNNGVGVTGVAPLAQVMALNTICTGNHLAASALAVAYAAKNGANVVSCSWYATTTSATFEAAVRKAYNEDNVLFVKSAGNQYGGGVTYPGTLPEFIAVSSLDASETLSGFSSRGTKVELSAPGGSVYSTYGTSYQYLSGTSMAAPHVAGTAALLFSKNADATNVAVRAALASTARDLGAAGRDSLYGFGEVEANAALTAI